MKTHYIPQPERSGFTLLEVVLSITILMTLTIATASLLKGAMHMNQDVAEQSALNNTLAMIMRKIDYDLQHAYIVGSKQIELNPDSRATKTIFQIRREGASYSALMTTMNHQALHKNAHESDETLIGYRVMAELGSKERHTSLFRGEAKVIPQNLEEQIPMLKLADNVKSLKFFCWDGDKWSDEGWDSNKKPWLDLLPQMISVELEVWEVSPYERIKSLDDEPTHKRSTIVFLTRSMGMREIKPRATNIKWEGK